MMRFTDFKRMAIFPGRSLSPVWGERFLCGGVLLTVGGWVTLHPPPAAPKLPSACRSTFQSRNVPVEFAAIKGFIVWADTSRGVYYYSTHPCYGRTPQGKYLDLRAAQRLGYRPSRGRIAE